MDESAVHDLRVAVRRLIATLTLVSLLLPTEKELLPIRELRRLFKSFARLRDFQVAIESIKKRKDGKLDIEFIKWLQKCERKAKTKVKRYLDNWDEKKVQVGLSEFPERLSKNIPASIKGTRFTTKLERIAQNTFSAVETRKLLPTDSEPETAHALRIAFKKYRYQVEVIYALCNGITPAFLKRMQHFQTTLGTLQDLIVFESLVTQYQKKHDGIEQEVLNRMLNRVAIEKVQATKGVIKESKNLQSFRIGKLTIRPSLERAKK